MSEAHQRLDKLKAQRAKLDKQIRSEAAKAGAEERKRKARQKYIVGGAILGSLKSLNEADKKLVINLLAAKVSEDDKKALADLIDFNSVECRALAYL
ncbi:MAG: hypothetical protein GX029_14235 [Pseudomonadaceae bacterium]|nr:hypothetical protein [Pseudomonadaceae bacterium]